MVSYRWRSDPQMLVLVTLMIGSFGSLITGSATSSTEMSRKPCQVTAFILVLRRAPVVTGQMRAGLRPHLQHAAVDHPRRSVA
jgi:L-lactate permease